MTVKQFNEKYKKMTVKEFNEKYNEIKTNAVHYHSSFTCEQHTDKDGNIASLYDDGYYKTLRYQGVDYVCETNYKGKSKVYIKNINNIIINDPHYK